MKVCIITCYKHPDYIRAVTLRAAFAAQPEVQLEVIKNSLTGIARYFQVLAAVFRQRLRGGSDLYVVTFRGYEIFPFVRLLTIGRTLWYDEFINPIEWAALEHRKVPNFGIFAFAYRQLVRTVQLVLTDTESHADFSAALTGIRRQKIVAIPVGGPEIAPADSRYSPADQPLDVFFYGTMLPLHGAKEMCDAAVQLRGENVRFTFVGSTKSSDALISQAINQGAPITHIPWLEFTELMGEMASADLILGGPFGDTVQSQFVITGKTYQALALRRPVVIGANDESGIFTDKKDALIVQRGNVASLVDAIKWAEAHRDALPLIAEAGYALYERELSQDVVTKRVAKLLADQFASRKS